MPPSSGQKSDPPLPHPHNWSFEIQRETSPGLQRSTKSGKVPQIGNPAMNDSRYKMKSSSNAGFSLVEMLIVVAIASIVSTVALIGFRISSRSFNLAGATRTLSTYLEKARLDSIRRHGVASVNIDSAVSYTVNIDFGGTGSPIARSVSLPQGTILTYTLPPATTSINPATTPITIAYDWRGRPGTAILLTLSDSMTGVGSSTVNIGSVGDVSTDTNITGPVVVPTPQTTVGTTAGVKSMN